MRSILVRKGPGTLMGISTKSAYRADVVIYIDDIVLHMDVSHPMPTRKTETGEEPGLIIDQFFKHSVSVEKPKQVEIEWFWASE